MRLNPKYLLTLILLLGLFLRFFRLTEVPVGFHGDELGAGYNAYSILKTGRDEYGRLLPLTFRESISPLNFYLMVPFVAIFGLTELAVRLPGVIWGLLTIVATYLLTKELFPQKKRVPVISSFLLAISPWHIQVSRIAHDAGLGLLLQVAATWLFFKGLKKSKFFLGSFLLFGLSIHAYHGPKITTPLLIATLIWLFRLKISKLIKPLVIFAGFYFVFVASFLNTPLKNNRLLGVSILVREATLKPALASVNQSPTLLTNLFYNPAVIYGYTFFRQYFNYLNPDWLFFDTSATRYFNVSRLGLVYLWTLPFFVVGIFQLVIQKAKRNKLPLLWLVIAPVAGAMTLGPANGGRGIMLLPMIQVVAAVGIVKIVRSKIVVGLTVGLLGLNSLFFLHQYFVRAPLEFPRQWSYGAREAVKVAVNYEDLTSKIIFTDAYKQPYIYLLFYGHQSPQWLQSISKHRRKSLGYDKLGKYEFREIDWEKDKVLDNVFVVGTADEIPATASGIIKEITAPGGQLMYRVARR